MTPEEVTQIEAVMEKYDFSTAEVIRLLESVGCEIQAAMNLIINGVPGNIEPIGLAHATEVEETMKSMQEHMGWGSQTCPGLVETEDGCPGGSP